MQKIFLQNQRPISGWLLVDKPRFITSTRVVAKIKKLFHAQKAGHAGTLDPLATGLLPIALGEATKTISYVLESTKTYQFTISWGAETTTDDLEGEIIKVSSSRPNEESIKKAMSSFMGEIWQAPPIFSAIKVNGQRSYDLARENKDFSLKKRLIHIYEFRLLNCENENFSTFEICCSKGTYIRSIARDIGQILGCFGHISQLRRASVSSFSKKVIDKMLPLEKYLSYQNQEDPKNFHYLKKIDTLLEPCELPLDYVDGYEVNNFAKEKLLKGQKISLSSQHVVFFPKINLQENFLFEQNIVKIFHNNRLLALGEKHNLSFHPKRIFFVE